MNGVPTKENWNISKFSKLKEKKYVKPMGTVFIESSFMQSIADHQTDYGKVSQILVITQRIKNLKPTKILFTELHFAEQTVAF